MKNLRQFSMYSSVADIEDRVLASTTGVSLLRKQGTDVIIRNNPKIDRQLLAEHERLEAASKSRGGVKNAEQIITWHTHLLVQTCLLMLTILGKV